MYNNIADWQQCNTQQDKLIFAINTLTRMRYCNEQGHLEFATKVAPEDNSNPTLTPWFNQQHSLLSNQKIHFWSLGFNSWQHGITLNLSRWIRDVYGETGSHAGDMKITDFFYQKSL